MHKKASRRKKITKLFKKILPSINYESKSYPENIRKLSGIHPYPELSTFNQLRIKIISGNYPELIHIRNFQLSIQQ